MVPLICLTASTIDLNERGTVGLEVGFAYPVDDEEGPGDNYLTIPVPRKKGQEKWILLGANSMTIEDVDGDGKFDVIASVQWQPDGGVQPVSERLILKLTRPCRESAYCDAVLERVE